MVSLFIIYTTHTTASVSLRSNETSCLFISWIVEITVRIYAALCKSSIYLSDDLNGLMIFKGYQHWVNYCSEMCCTLQIFHLYNRSFKWFDDFYGLVERMQLSFCHVTNKCHENFSLTLLLMGGGLDSSVTFDFCDPKPNDNVQSQKRLYIHKCPLVSLSVCQQNPSTA